MKLLVVEDDPLQFELLKRLLSQPEANQHEVLHANTLAKALEQLNGQNFDAILCDLNLPDSKGLQTVERVRAAGPDFPLIVFTSNDDEGTGIEAMRKGAQDYVIKGQPDSRALKRILNYSVERKKIQDRLVESEKHETVARLSAGVAHHFNNLMAVIMGYGQIFLENTKPDHPQYRGLKEICKAAQKAGELARHLLTFSEKTLEYSQELNLNKQIDAGRNILTALVGNAVKFEISLAPEMRTIHADPSYIDKLLTILIMNSRDAINGKGEISIDTYMESFPAEKKTRYSVLKAGSYAVLQIADNGQGMSEKVKARLFEPFFTTKEVGQGVGLGLATVYGLLKQLNAGVDVISGVGSGTSFRIYFPVYKA